MLSRLPRNAPPRQALAWFVILLVTNGIHLHADAPGDRQEPGTAWGFIGSYGFGHPINGSAGDIEFKTVSARWSWITKQRGDGPLRAHPGLAIEMFPAMAFQDDAGDVFGVGLDLLYEHRFAGRGRVLPTWRGGGGFLYADREVPEFGTRYNFSLLLEFGVDVLLGEGTALLVEYRFRHVSNADLAGSNPGINAHGLAIGLTLFLGETFPGRGR